MFSQITNIAQAAIKDIVIGFVEVDYVLNRDLVRITISRALEDLLDRQVYVTAPAETFQLLNVYFPDSVVSKNLEASIALQTNEVALLQQQQVVNVQSESKRQVAEIQAMTNQLLQYARSNPIKLFLKLKILMLQLDYKLEHLVLPHF